MNKNIEIMFNNNSEEIINHNKILPLFFSEFTQDPITLNLNQNSFNREKEDNILVVQNIKNIFQEETLSLNESDDEENEKSIYFIKKQDNLDTESRSTENSTYNFGLEPEKFLQNKKETIIQKKINFKTFLKKKRGKKAKFEDSTISKKCHGSEDFDNIQRKIQVHFISFLTNFINDIIRNFIKTRNVPQFSKIDYKLKKTVNHKYFQNLKKLKIADILQMRPSPKMKMHDISVNKNIYEKVCKLCPFIQEFLQQDFISIFKEYYNNKSRIYNLNGREITFSDRTKTFIDLINKNYAYKEKIKFIALNYFLEDDKASEKIKFKTNRELIDNNITRE